MCKWVHFPKFVKSSLKYHIIVENQNPGPCVILFHNYQSFSLHMQVVHFPKIVKSSKILSHCQKSKSMSMHTCSCICMVKFFMEKSHRHITFLIIREGILHLGQILCLVSLKSFTSGSLLSH